MKINNSSHSYSEFAMELKDMYQLLETFYIRIEPHHETWMLWLKKKSKEEVFEVAIGTILVQNTNWKNVDLAISNLFKHEIKSFEDLKNLGIEILEEMIRPAGFYKQKARSLYSLADVFMSVYSKESNYPTRDELLQIKGVGKESADSILLYCFYQAVPIVGTYTRRFFARLFGEIDYLKVKYEIIQDIIGTSLSCDYYTLGKFHALIVSHSQQICQKVVPFCYECLLNSHCTYGNFHQTQPSLLKIQDAINKPKSAK